MPHFSDPEDFPPVPVGRQASTAWTTHPVLLFPHRESATDVFHSRHYRPPESHYIPGSAPVPLSLLWPSGSYPCGSSVIPLRQEVPFSRKAPVKHSDLSDMPEPHGCPVPPGSAPSGKKDPLPGTVDASGRAVLSPVPDAAFSQDFHRFPG